MERKVSIALKKYIVGKLTQNNVEDAPKSMIQKDLDYVNSICQEYKEFRKQEDNLVLFGSELELNDIKRSANRSQKAT